ncbi:DUF5320 domain-containing protein [Candidatus Woesearchaeota archaeon]|nr:DUF5320 domain-containing protein [Candidatus Woesearchaeota archaeon]
MPWGDGTGPWWAQGRGWRCWRGFGRAYAWRYSAPLGLTIEEQRRLLEAELNQLEAEKRAIEERLKQLGSQQNG